MKAKLYQVLPLTILLTIPTVSSKENGFVPPADYTELCEGVYVSKAPGFYSHNLSLSFALDPTYELYYSFDYDNSDISQMEKYTDNISVAKNTERKLSDYPLTTSVDAILKNDTGGKCVSDTYINNIQKTGNYVLNDKQPVLGIKVIKKDTKETVLSRSLTYLIEDDILKDIKIPVVSLSLPEDEIMSDNKGFYNKIREDIAKRANLEFFDPEYQESFYRNTQIKLGGNWTLGYPLRTFNLNFNKDENGKKNAKVTEHVFQERSTRSDKNKRLTKLTRVRLHNGGNAFESWTRMNDALLQRIMEDSKASTTGYRPCIVYLNGEYWGLMSLREHYKDVYFEGNYGVDKDNVITYDLKGTFSVDEGDTTIGEEKLKAMENYLQNDFTDDTVYRNFLDRYLDLDSFLDVILAQAYSGNWDFIGNNNNLKMWTVKDTNPQSKYEDGKFRFVLHDADFAFTSNANPLYPYHDNSYSKYPLMKKLLENASFRTSLLRRTEELMETVFDPYHCMDVLNTMAEEVRPYRMASDLRWGQKESDLSSWNGQLNQTFSYFTEKGRSFYQEVKNIMKMYERN